MKRVLLIIAAVMLCCCLSMSGRKRDVKFSNAGTAYIERSFSTYDVLQKQIHSLAELGYMEYRSSGLLASHLESNGFRVEMGVAGIPTAFVATLAAAVRSSACWRSMMRFRECLRILLHIKKH